VTSTPAGTVIGAFPMRDIASYFSFGPVRVTRRNT
jgi:hypothetical protein